MDKGDNKGRIIMRRILEADHQRYGCHECGCDGIGDILEEINGVRKITCPDPDCSAISIVCANDRYKIGSNIFGGSVSKHPRNGTWHSLDNLEKYVDRGEWCRRFKKKTYELSSSLYCRVDGSSSAYNIIHMIEDYSADNTFHGIVFPDVDDAIVEIRYMNEDLDKSELLLSAIEENDYAITGEIIRNASLGLTPKRFGHTRGRQRPQD